MGGLKAMEKVNINTGDGFLKPVRHISPKEGSFSNIGVTKDNAFEGKLAGNAFVIISDV